MLLDLTRGDIIIVPGTRYRASRAIDIYSWANFLLLGSSQLSWALLHCVYVLSSAHSTIRLTLSSVGQCRQTLPSSAGLWASASSSALESDASRASPQHHLKESKFLYIERGRERENLFLSPPLSQDPHQDPSRMEVMSPHGILSCLIAVLFLASIPHRSQAAAPQVSRFRCPSLCFWCSSSQFAQILWGFLVFLKMGTCWIGLLFCFLIWRLMRRSWCR